MTTIIAPLWLKSLWPTDWQRLLPNTSIVKSELKYWGYVSERKPESNEELIQRDLYQGIRPAPGYPACPDHLEKQYPCGNLMEVEETHWS